MRNEFLLLPSGKSNSLRLVKDEGAEKHRELKEFAQGCSEDEQQKQAKRLGFLTCNLVPLSFYSWCLLLLPGYSAEIWETLH